MQIKIVALENRTNAGDDDKAKAVQKSLQNQLATKHEVLTDAVNVTIPEQIARLENEITQSKEAFFIILGGGMHCIAPLSDLSRNESLKSKIYTSWSGHQLFDVLAQHAANIDSIALPQHIDISALEQALANPDSETKEAAGNSKIIKTIGVVHNSTLEDLVSEYAKIKDAVIPAQKYKFVYLAGDAPMPDNTTYRYYTEEEAYSLGKYVAQNLENNEVLIVTNGPRTGQFVPDPNDATRKIKDPLSHYANRENLEPINYELDKVSAAFIAALEESGVFVTKNKLEATNGEEKAAQQQKQAQFFDFQFTWQNKDGKIVKLGNSLYKGLLGAVACNAGSTALLPGESISAPSEACDLLKPGMVTVYENNAMNPDHISYVKALDATGQIQLLKMAQDKELPEFSLQECKLLGDGSKYPSAAEMIANTIIKGLAKFPQFVSNIVPIRGISPRPTSPDVIAQSSKLQQFGI